eukprot:6979021-Pyramimonas_sp.AAC.1
MELAKQVKAAVSRHASVTAQASTLIHQIDNSKDWEWAKQDAFSKLLRDTYNDLSERVSSNTNMAMALTKDVAQLRKAFNDIEFTKLAKDFSHLDQAYETVEQQVGILIGFDNVRKNGKDGASAPKAKAKSKAKRSAA